VSLQTRGSDPADNGVIHVKRNGARISVRLNRKKSETRSPLNDLYNVNLKKYDLHPNYKFPEKIRGLIPEGTPPYIQGDHDYVKQMIRALYYFKQCALIGPSGTERHISRTLLLNLQGCLCMK